MKRLALCLLFAAACGGGNKSTPSTMPTQPEPVARPAAPDCKAAADHIAAGDENFAGAVEWRCKDNQWSDDTRRCLAEQPADACDLTEEQKASIADARAKASSGEEGRMGKRDSDRAEGQYKMKKEAPPAEEAPRTRGAVKKQPAGDGRTADPCEGGE